MQLHQDTDLQLAPVPGASTPPGLHIATLASAPAVGVLLLARPDKANAFDASMWAGLAKAVHDLEAVPTVQAVLLAGEGLHFCAGIDTGFLAGMMAEVKAHSCPAQAREHFRTGLMRLQEAITSLERCKWPVVAAVHGACVGGGVDLITAADIRVCSKDATFCVKEVDLAITADLGTLQRLPHIIGQGATADLALTCRVVGSEEALRLGLVSQVLGDGRGELLSSSAQLAAAIAAKPQLALMGTKRVLRHTRDAAGGVPAGLEYVAIYNAAMLISKDLEDRMKGGGRARSKL